MPKGKFMCSPVGGDRKHYLTEEDVRVVLSRLPVEAWNGLRKVHFNDKSRGGRRLVMQTRANMRSLSARYRRD